MLINNKMEKEILRNYITKLRREAFDVASSYKNRNKEQYGFELGIMNVCDRVLYFLDNGSFNK